MAVKLPRGPATNIIAIITLLAFLPVQLTGETDRVALLAGFIAERVNALAAQNITMDIPGCRSGSRRSAPRSFMAAGCILSSTC